MFRHRCAGVGSRTRRTQAAEEALLVADQSVAVRLHSDFGVLRCDLRLQYLKGKRTIGQSAAEWWTLVVLFEQALCTTPVSGRYGLLSLVIGLCFSNTTRLYVDSS
jgi:hypothetical protein